MKNKMLAAILPVLCLTSISCEKTSSTSDSKSEAEISSARKNSGEQLSTVTSTTASDVTSDVSESVTETQPPTAPIKLSGAKTVPVYAELTINGFLTEADVAVLNGNEPLDTSETGEKSVTVRYSADGKEQEKTLTYLVEDTEAPVILNSGWNPYHHVGEAFDLNDYVGFADNYDSSPVLTYDGYINPDTVGDYPLTAYVSDSSGNAVSWDLTISVVSSVPTPPDDRERIDFSDFAYIYGNLGRPGIDVSTWQGNIDWSAVRDAGCEFAVIRMGYSYDNIVMDDCFYANIEGARSAGIDLSVYFYTTANSEDEIREQAKWIADNLNGAELDLPVGFDWEEFDSFQKYGMNIKQINDLYAVFADEMAEYGYDTMLYSSKNFLNNIWNEHSKSISPVWLAHYVEGTDYEGEYSIWQQSNCGRIPGIYGDVDLNIMF